jgi:hypothetical protein
MSTKIYNLKTGAVAVMDSGDILPDGWALSVRLPMMDSMQREVAATNPRTALLRRYVADSNLADSQVLLTDGCGFAAGFKPGFVYASSGTQVLRDAAAYEEVRSACEDAYLERKAMLSDAWRTPPAAVIDDDALASTEVRDTDTRDAALAARDARSCEAWRAAR